MALSAPAAARPRPPVVAGYLLVASDLDAALARADLAAFNHINLAFANPTPDGSFIDAKTGTLPCMTGAQGAPVTVTALRAVVARLHANQRKVLLSLGGGILPTCAGDWQALLAPGRREATVTALVGLTETLGLNGLDVDLEGGLLTAIDAAGNFTPFMAALSQAMHHRDKLLTCATASYAGGAIPATALPYCDLLYLMSYDAIGPGWGTPGGEHAPYALAEQNLDQWLALGVAPERLVLGLPFYGRGQGGEQPYWPYRDLVARFGDTVADGDVIGTLCPTCRYISYNGPATIERKARLARDRAGGVMVWEIAQDSPDHALTRALQRGLGTIR